MVLNFLKISIRNLTRNKVYSLINILGLSIGMACSILIALYIIDELSYDRYHKNSDNIYRLGFDAKLGGKEVQGVLLGLPAGPILKEEIPEIESFVRLVYIDHNKEAIIKKDDKLYLEKNVFYTDSSFFDVFDVEIIHGNPHNLLTNPFEIAISETTARKYFGNTNVLDKSLNIANNEYIIKAVVRDCPANSHFHYNILASLVDTKYAGYSTWIVNDIAFTYFLCRENINPIQLQNKILKIAIKHVEKELEAIFKSNIDEFFQSGNNKYEYKLQALKDIHLHSHSNFELETNSDIKYIYIFSLIALFILIIACINFMNLSTARSAKRAKEIGIRKVVGGSRASLFRQFLFESVLLSFISLLIAMIIIESVLPLFNNLVSKEIAIGYFSNGFMLPSLFLLAILVGLFSGLYSAGYLSSLKMLSALKNNIFANNKNNWFRNSLVIFQFAISIILVISTFVVYSQLMYIKNKDLGFDKEHILIVNNAKQIRNSFESFKQELEKNTSISNVTYSSSYPSTMFYGFPLIVSRAEGSDSYAPRVLEVEKDFAKTYGLELIEGRFFSHKYSTDTSSIILNQSAVKEFRLEKPVVGQQIYTTHSGNRAWKIIGIVKDFNFQSLYQDIGSLVFIDNNFIKYISVKFNDGINTQKIQLVQNAWEKFVHDTPFDYSIMKDDFMLLHKKEFKTAEVFAIFSILAIFIACLGLLGLASFIVEQKTKEIGIRKAMGASTLSIIGLLFKQFSIWILLANIIAWPLAYIFMNNWLHNFAYHTSIQFWIFALASISILILALSTVSFQAIKAAQANPVDNLRYE
ncbi:MAG: ABC transporter permease [Bacteroidales bacterium]|nr:ABC transporter permease [Bacteroidales bacterium]